VWSDVFRCECGQEIVYWDEAVDQEQVILGMSHWARCVPTHFSQANQGLSGTLYKQHSTYKQITGTVIAKQDLIISAYKPNGGLEERFRLEAGTAEGAWDFVRQHLKQLPVVVRKGDRLEVVAERQRHLLYDRMVAYHLQRGASVPLGAAEFYRGLEQRFTGREGMYFLPEQVLEYDRARLQGGGGGSN